MRSAIFSMFFFSLCSAEIQIGKEILTVEVVDTHETRSKGLMGRRELKEGHGMLFVYDYPQQLVFWMKNTVIPLSIAFFNKNKQLLNLINMDPPVGNHLIRYRSSGPALYALEVPQGWFQKHGIGVGAKFSFLDSTSQVQ